MKIISHILAFMALALVSLQAGAQGLPFVRNFSADDYEAHNRNFDILAEKGEGVVYVANFEGLLIYDNATWDIKHTPGITRLTKVFQDSRGTIWVGGYNYIGYLDYTLEQDMQLMGLENVDDFRGQVNKIWEEGGTVFFSTVSGNVFKIEGERFVESKTAIPEEILADGVNDRLELSPGFWAEATDGSGMRFKDGDGNVIFTYNEDNGLISNNVTAITYDGYGILWGATDNGVFAMMVPSAYTHFTPSEGLRGEVISMSWYNDELYVGTMSGLYRKNGTRFENVPGINYACWILSQREDALLAATSNGVYRLRGGKVEQLTTASTTALLLGENGFYSGEIDAVYFNTRNGDHTKVADLENVTSMHVDEDGVMWLRNIYGVVWRSNGRGGFEPYAEDDELATYIYYKGEVTVVNANAEEPFPYPGFSYADDQGVLWLTDNEGKNIYAYKDGQRMEEFEPVLEPLHNYTLRAMLVHDGLMWIGGGFGLVALDITRPDPLLTSENDLDICSVRLGDMTMIWGGFGDPPASLRSLSSDDRHLRFTYALNFESLVGQTLYRYRLNKNNWTPWSENHLTEFVNLSYGSYTLSVQAMDAKGMIWDTEPLEFSIKYPFYLKWYMFLFDGLLFLGLVMMVARWRTYRLEQEKLRLEGIVQERTAEVVQQRDEISKQKDEIEEKSASLEKALDDLEQAQSKLIRQEKMATAGKLTQGLIDRILNPMNYINNFSKLSSGLIKDLKANIEDEEDNMDQENFEDTMDVLDMLTQNLEKVEQHGLNTSRILKAMEEILKEQTGGMQEMNLVELIRQNFEMLKKYYDKDIAQSNIVTKLNCDYEKLMIKGNNEQLTKTLIHIMRNSIYSLAKKKKQQPTFSPELNVSVKKQENKVSISVHDNGMGIENTIIDKIFDPFFTTKTTAEAAGVGLYLCHDIIQSHGGIILVASEKDKYAEFTVELPLLADNANKGQDNDN